MKKLLLVLLLVTISVGLTGCKDKASYEGLDTGISGQIDLLLWSGSGEYLEDIGHQNLDETQLLAQNDAATYYVAKEFNKIYPNVVINVLAVQGGPTDGRIWAQEIENYKTDNGVYPTIWASTDLAGDVADGNVADLTRFADDPFYKAMNPSIMQMMNYHGFQAGLPQYILPWGIYVNKELAEAQNLDVPEPNWTIEDYTDFQGNSEADEWYGSMDTPIRIIETGTNDIVKSLFNYQGGDYVTLDSNEVKSLIPYFEEWNDNAVYGNEVSDAMWADVGGWAYDWFRKGKLLTFEGDPWMMGDAAIPDETWWAAALIDDWDIYPRPSTDYTDNTIGIVLDPMAIYNSCLDDENIACTVEEEAKIKLNYTFASFWIADTASWTARAEGMFTDEANNKTSSSLNDSFPVTTGDLFDEQLNIWYTPVKHQRFSDPSVMPGFHEVIRIYEAGQFWDVSDKAYPYFYTVEGSRKPNLEEWRNYWDPNFNGGFEKGDAGFEDAVLGSLQKWSEDANIRFAQSFADLEAGLRTYYGYQDEDFDNN